MSEESKAQGVTERLRARAQAERAIQANNLAVAEALKPQIDAFNRHDGSHNTFAVRLAFDHQSAAKHDGELAADWDEAADLITLQATTIAEQAGEIERLTEDRGSWRRVSERLGTEKAALDALVSRLKEALERALPYVESINSAEHSFDGFQIVDGQPVARQRPANTDSLVADVRALLSELGERGE